MSERSGRFHPLLAGAALGVSFGGCLVGLNPELLPGVSALRALAVAALLGAALAAPLCLRAAAVPSAGTWLALSGAFVLVAAFAERQRSLFYLFVPNGGRRVLVAVAVLASSAAALALLAAFTRPGAAASRRLLLGVVLALGAAPLAGRRVVDRPEFATPPAVPRMAQRSLLVVGLEGVSYELATGWARDGTLPVLARLLQNGSSGPLRTLPVYDRAALWTSTATGKRPSKTGVVSGGHDATPFGPLRLRPRLPGGAALQLGPYRATAPARRALTFWEILAARGHEAAVLNWPATHPARDGLVLWASERLFEEGSAPDAARPAEAAERARLFKLGPSNLDHTLVRALVPEGVPEADPARRAVLSGAALDLTVVGAALGAVPTGPLNAAALVLTGLSRAAPELAREPDREREGLRAYYRFLDETLGELLNREGKDRTLCLFTPAGGGLAGDGLLVLHGSGITAGGRLTSAHVLDLAPTLLVLAGEPIARDMDGRVLAEAFDERFRESASIPIVDSFEPEARGR